MYLTCKPTPIRVYRSFIPKGARGTLATTRHIIRLIRLGAKDLCVRQTAIAVFRTHRIRSKDYLGEIAALFHWVRRNIRYTRDIHRVELLHSARRLLEMRAGDCDDMTIILGALLEATGHPVRLVLVGSNPRRKTLYTHIYLEVWHQGEWIALDPTMRRPMGWAPPAPNRRVVPIRRRT